MVRTTVNAPRREDGRGHGNRRLSPDASNTVAVAGGCSNGRPHGQDQDARHLPPRVALVVVWEHRGNRHKSFHATNGQRAGGEGQRDSGDRRPASRELFEDYAREWLGTYRGRTARGIGERTLGSYRRDLEKRAYPSLGHLRLREIEPPDVRRFVTDLEADGLAPGTVRAVLAPVRAMFATAVEDGALRSNPPARSEPEEASGDSRGAHPRIDRERQEQEQRARGGPDDGSRDE